MTRRLRRSVSASYFEGLYSAKADPWRYETSVYEAHKYSATLAALPRPHYRSAFEIGCSIGVLTEQLAPRCTALLAVDVSTLALELAAERCRAFPQVRFGRMRVPEELPECSFELIVLSEVGYYWSRATLARARRGMVARLQRGGHLLLVHWTPFVSDALLSGDEVHQAFFERGTLRHLGGQREATYRLDLFERV